MVTYLFVNYHSQSRLAFHDRVRHTHLPAQCGQEDNQFDGIHVVGDQDQPGSLVLNQPHYVVEAVLDRVRLLADLLLLFALLHGRRLL